MGTNAGAFDESTTFLPLIYDGTIPAYVYRNDGWGQPAPNREDQMIGQALIGAMIQVVVPVAESIPDHVAPPLPRALSAELIASLREDGLDFMGGKVIPAKVKAVDLKKEDEYLIALIRTIKPPNVAEIQHHHDESEMAFADGAWGGASSEARNFLAASLRGLREVATVRGKIPAYKQPGKDRPLIEDFRTIGLFTEEEKNAVMHVWGSFEPFRPTRRHKKKKTARGYRASWLLA